MDTKSKKSKYNPLIKITAVLLIGVFSFFAAFQGLNFLRKAIYYSSEKSNVSGTIAFNYAIKDTLSTIQSFKNETDGKEAWDNITYEEFLNTQRAKEVQKNYRDSEDRALKLYNTIQALKKLQPTEYSEEEAKTFWISPDGEGYYDDEGNEFYSLNDLQQYMYNNHPNTAYRILPGSYNESDDSFEYSYDTDVTEVTSYYPDAPIPSSDEELFSIKKSYSSYNEWLIKYTQLRKAIFDIVDDATSEETIHNELDQKCNQALRLSYDEHYTQVQEELKRLVNVKFILINNETGKILSNVNKSKQDSFIKNLAKDSVYYINFSDNTLHSQSLELDEKGNFLKFLKESDILATSNLDNNYFKRFFTGYTLYLKVEETVEQGDIFFNIASTYNSISSTSEDSYLTQMILFAVIAFVILCILCALSGKRQDDSIKLLPTDKIPFLVRIPIALAILILLIVGAVYGMYADSTPSYFFNSDNTLNALLWLMTTNTLGIVIGITASLFALEFSDTVLYIARNVKAGTFANRFLTGFLWKKYRTFKKQYDEKTILSKTIKKRITRGLLLWFIANFVIFLIAIDYYPLALIVFLIFNLLFIAYGFIYISDVYRLANLAEQIRSGSLNTVIKPSNYVKPLRKFAEDISECQSSVKTAVEEALKGEHLKTELITNVSHDLKTPLTSIISYVSLLKMRPIEDEEAKNYIDVLDNKSRKLQRLIEDLVEASKATSGNIKMNFGVVDLNELALQAVGENSDVLENAGLDLILNEKDEQISVVADSQHTFRVIDNLFSNARKYSLKGTRVYVDVYKENDYGVFAIKNISREKLNLTPEELTARFVRGDNSRSTDGSGLGLSIAQSFTELQNGVFEIKIDGDMFTAFVKLPIALFMNTTRNEDNTTDSKANPPTSPTEPQPTEQTPTEQTPTEQTPVEEQPENE